MAKKCCHYRGTAGRRATLCVNPNEQCPETFGGLRLVSQNTVKDGCADCFQSGSAVSDALDDPPADCGCENEDDSVDVIPPERHPKR